MFNVQMAIVFKPFLLEKSLFSKSVLEFSSYEDQQTIVVLNMAKYTIISLILTDCVPIFLGVKTPLGLAMLTYIYIYIYI